MGRLIRRQRGSSRRSYHRAARRCSEGFKPSALTVAAGDTVTFQWFGQNTHLHQVVVIGLPSGTATSANQKNGTFAVVFPTGGTYAIADNDASFTATVSVIH